ncbi:MAG: hypothetical protein CMI02_00760 [Oceanospirillaceae bacterium]|nr:hypothetical protein [Oceanospirillaceae bacterium]MBT10549.1 hypothetical protein [Oceanospirillaceae bacterium]|tara:strand:- start:132108 stop:132536 length:429 start_codon:yes stop_codon:yes gene_type:complete
MNRTELPSAEEQQIARIRRRLIKLFSFWLLIPVMSVSSDGSVEAQWLTGIVSLVVLLVSGLFIGWYRPLFRCFWAEKSIRIRLILLILSVPFLTLPLEIKASGASHVPVFIYLVFWSAVGYSILFSESSSGIIRDYSRRHQK